jgi:hypothetical protein
MRHMSLSGYEDALERSRLFGRATHKNHHLKVLPGMNRADLEIDLQQFLLMSNEQLQDFIGGWTCPDRGNCAWVKYIEAE